MKTCFPMLFAGLLLTGVSQAVVVANYNFDDPSTTVAKVTSDDADPRSTAGSFTTSGGGGNAAVSASTDMAFFRSGDLTNTFDGAVTGADYFTFTVTPGAGNLYSYTTLDFLFGGSSGTAAGSEFTASTVLQASVGGGAYFTIGSPVDKAVGASTSNQLSAASFDLTGVSALQNTSSAVTFRFYLYSSGAGNADRIVRMDNVVLNDNTVIPEPSAVLLGALGAGFAFLRRRRA